MVRAGWFPGHLSFACLLCVSALAVSACDDGDPSSPGDADTATVDTTAGDADTGDAASDAVEPADADADADSSELLRARARFEFGEDGTLPFPFDVFTEPADTPTGLQLALGVRNTRLIDEGVDNGIVDADALRTALNRTDGFSVSAALAVAYEGDLELPSPGAPSGPDDGVWLVALDETAPDAGQARTVTLSVIERRPRILSIQPNRPLEPATRYGLVVGSQLLDPDPRFVEVFGESAPSDPEAATVHRALEPLRTRLPDLGIDPADVAVASVFTTQSAPRTMQAVRDAVAIADPSPTLETDAGGALRIYATTDLEPPPAEVQDTSGVAVVLRGTIDAPDFRDAAGDVRLVDGEAVAASSRALPFWLFLPEAAADGPVRLAVVQHGNGARKEYALHIAGELARAGFAAVAMDLPNHGEREGEGNFFAFTDLSLARGTFLQAEADLLSLLHAVRKLGAEVTVDAMPLAAPDGVPDVTVADGAYYVGVSLGGITGTVANALSPHTSAAVLNVTGGGLAGLIEPFLAIAGDNPVFVMQVGVVFQTLIDPADPLTFVGGLGDQTGPDGQPREVILQIVIDDSIVPNDISRRMAEALDLPLVCPCPVEGTAFEGMPTVESPHAGSGLTISAGVTHGGLLGDWMTGPAVSAAMRASVIEFFATDRDSGVAKVTTTP